jgi:hypothetical protein
VTLPSLVRFSVSTEGHLASPSTPSDTFFLSGTGSPHHELHSFILSSPSFIAQFRSSFRFRRFLSTNEPLTSSLDLSTLATLPSLDSLSLDRNSAFATMSQLHSAPNPVRLFGTEELVEQALTNLNLPAVTTALSRFLLRSLQRRHSFHHRHPLLRLLRLPQLSLINSPERDQKLK